MNNQSTNLDYISTYLDSNMDPMQQLLGDHPTIWVFGYGSLLWKPDFPYKSKQVGYINGYKRRFYQGNVTFRGKPGKPGRVANLVEDKESQAWGVAYEISGCEEVASVLKALYSREATSGGYVTMVTTFHPRQTQNEARETKTKANKDNHLHTVVSSSLGSNNESEPSHPGSSLSSERRYSWFPSSLKRVESDVSVESFGDSTSDEDDLDGASDDMKAAGSSTSFSSHKTDDSLRFHLDDHKSDAESKPLVHKQTRMANLENTAETADHYALHSNNESFSKQTKALYPNTHMHQPSLSPVQVLLYTATPENDLYLGSDNLTSMARQIVNSNGSAGTNVEYVTKIADYVRKYIPEDEDTHLFALDAKIREEVYRQHSNGSIRIQLGFSDLAHDVEHESILEPVMAS